MQAAFQSSSEQHRYLFKQDLSLLANAIDIEIRVAHYPAYCSKYNPLEHRLLPQVTISNWKIR